MIKGYFPAYLAQLFPNLANLYEKISGKQIPYRKNAVILSAEPRRENMLIGARFTPAVEKLLEQKASS